MPDWTDVKEEGKPAFPRASAVELNGCAGSTEPHGRKQSNPLPEPERHAIHARTHSGTPSDRQRTVQACDKCRERKTKCSGDHPVCHRCTARGLTCQYSSREPRTRGPSKARLRNAVSSSDLRSSDIRASPFNPNNLPQAKPERPTHQLQRFRSNLSHDSNGMPRGTYLGLRRVASIPRAHFNSKHGRKSALSTPLPATSYQTWRDTCAAPPSPFSFDDGSFATSQFQLPSISHYTAGGGGSASPWRDVRRVQSHSTLIGSAGITNLKKNIDYGMHSPLPLMNGGSDYLGTGHVSVRGRHSPDFLGSLQSFEHTMPQYPLSSFEHQTQPLHTPDVHPWVPPDLLASDGSLSYSPTSSSDDGLDSRPKSGNAAAATPATSTFLDVSSPFDFLSLNSPSSGGGYSGDLTGCGTGIGGNYFLGSQQQHNCGGGGPLAFPDSADMPPLNDHFSGLVMGGPMMSRSGPDPILGAADAGLMYP